MVNLCFNVVFTDLPQLFVQICRDLVGAEIFNSLKRKRNKQILLYSYMWFYKKGGHPFPEKNSASPSFHPANCCVQTPETDLALQWNRRYRQAVPSTAHTPSVELQCQSLTWSCRTGISKIKDGTLISSSSLLGFIAQSSHLRYNFINCCALQVTLILVKKHCQINFLLQSFL